MIELDTTRKAALVPSPGTERRWPARMALLTAWWLPATTARRTQHVSLKAAYAIHLISAGVAGILALAMLLWVACPWELTWSLISQLIVELDQEITRDFQRRPEEVVLTVVGTVFGVEAGFVGLALLLAPWGAADEPFLDSIRNALRQVWLHTADAIPVALILPALLISIQGLSEKDRDEWLAADRSLVRPAGPYIPPGTPAGDEYQRQMRQYWEQRQVLDWTWRSRRHWYQNHADELCGGLSIAVCTCVLWAMMRAIGARRPVPPPVRPTVCDDCGYNLRGTPMDSRCPECGRPVVDSLGPHARPGAPWEHRRELGRLRAWWRTVTDAAVRPDRLGKQLRVSAGSVDHRVFPAVHALAVLLMIYGGFMALPFVIDSLRMDRRALVHLAWNEAPATAVFCFAVMLVLPMLAAGMVGAALRLQCGRNLLPAAMQVASYLSAFLAGCIAASCLLLTGIVAFVESQRLSGASGPGQMRRVIICMMGWLAFSALMLIIYLARVYQGTLRTRYSNR